MTYYSFDGDGNGLLELPENSYAFTYSINGNVLSIDFENENIRDFTYDFKVNGKKLTLVGGEGDKRYRTIYQKRNNLIKSTKIIVKSPNLLTYMLNLCYTYLKTV